MCEFHLKGQCFHPKRVERGEIATACEAHACDHCTSSSWQVKHIKERVAYLKELIQLSGGKLPSFIPESQAEQISRIFG